MPRMSISRSNRALTPDLPVNSSRIILTATRSPVRRDAEVDGPHPTLAEPSRKPDIADLPGIG